MKKYIKIGVLLLLIIVLISPFIVFYTVFGGLKISKDIECWAQFGEYLNGTFMPVIVLTGILVTFLLGIISDKRNKNAILVEQQKQRPLLFVDFFDGENRILLEIKNKGNGPLMIDSYYLLNTKDGKRVNSIFEILPNINFVYDNYSSNLNNYVLSAGDSIELLSIGIEHEKNKEIIGKFQIVREKLRRTLSKHKIIVEYSDIFGNNMPTYTRSLEWFNRYALYNY